MAWKIEPLGERVVIERVEPENKTESGLIIPEIARETPTEGIVIAVGPGRQLDNGQLSQMHLKPGDRVLVGKYSGFDVEIDDKTYLVITQSEVIGKLVDESDKRE